MSFEFYKLECLVTNNTYCENMVCEIKTIRRGVQALNIHADLLVELNDIFIMNIEVTSKTSTNAFKNLVFNVSANLCGNIYETPLLKMISPLLDKFAPGLIHECPYPPKKGFGLHDMIIDPSLLPLISLATFERVDYRVHTTYTDKHGITLLKVTLYARLQPKTIRKKTATVAAKSGLTKLFI